MSTRQRAPVTSSLLASIAYSEQAVLEIEFRNGALYRYFAVPHSVVAQLLAADSKGSWFNRHVRNRFRYQRLS